MIQLDDDYAEEPLSDGYPYFVQELASAAWLARRTSAITGRDVETVMPGVTRMLDQERFDEQFAQVSPREMIYVLALHELGPGAHRTEEIAHALDRPSSSLSSIRMQLLKKDIIVTPSRGVIEFRLPLTISYVARHHAALAKRGRLGALPRR